MNTIRLAGFCHYRDAENGVDLKRIIHYNVFASVSHQVIRCLRTVGPKVTAAKIIEQLSPLFDDRELKEFVPEGQYNVIFNDSGEVTVFHDDLQGNLTNIEDPDVLQHVYRASDVGIKEYLRNTEMKVAVVGGRALATSAAALLKEYDYSVAIEELRDPEDTLPFHLFKPKGTNVPGNGKSMHNKVRPGKFFNKNKTFRSSGRGR